MPSTALPSLRSQMRAIQPLHRHGLLPFGAAEVDGALGGGLALGALHEVAADGLEAELGAAAAGFVACLLGAMADEARPLLWIAQVCDLYPPGLLALGLDPARLIFASARSDALALEAMEAALRTGAMGAVVGEVQKLGRLSGRRLQLACLRQGSTGFLLRRWPYGRRAGGEDSLAVTRWTIAPARSAIAHGEPGPARWRVRLLSARGGGEGEWLMEATGGFDVPHTLRVVSPLADPAAGPRRLAHG